MNTPWPTVQLGEVLRRSTETVEIHPDAEYSEITVKLWGKGVVLRGLISGAAIAGSRRLLAKSGQFILSRIDARNGASGIVPEELDGAVVTNDFPIFDLASSRLAPKFLGWMSRTKGFVELCRRASEGTTNRVRLQEERFLSLKVPLPPLGEQRRIVARVEAMASEIAEARSLRAQSVEESKALLHSQIGEVFNGLARVTPPRPFVSFSPHVTSGPRNWAKHYQEDGYRFYRAQDIGPEGQVFQWSKVFIEPPQGEQGRIAELQQGDLMLVITGATVGRAAVFRAGLEPGFVSQHVAICRLPAESVDPEFATWGLRSPQGQAQLLGQCYGQGKPGLNLSNIRALKMPFPPLPEQRRIVRYLDGVQAKVDALKKLQAETAAELATLLPSILDRAFKGEL
jgi:type I restriction enzyme S subunit